MKAIGYSKVGKYRQTISFNADYNEYEVTTFDFREGATRGGSTYFTDDKDDAIATAKKIREDIEGVCIFEGDPE